MDKLTKEEIQRLDALYDECLEEVIKEHLRHTLKRLVGGYTPEYTTPLDIDPDTVRDARRKVENLRRSIQNDMMVFRAKEREGSQE